MPFAFPREPESAATFTACIVRLEREHFRVILVDPQGVLMTYLLKDGEAAKSNDDVDVEVHVSERDYSDNDSSDE